MQNRKTSDKKTHVSILKNPWDKKIGNIIIEITDQKETITLEKRKAFAFTSNIIIGDQCIPLDSLNHDNRLQLPTQNKTYDIIFKYSYLGEQRQIKLPENMNKNLLNFLTGGRRKDECCMDFINDLYFGCYSEKVNVINLLGSGVPLENNTKLGIGQAISIGKDLHGKYEANHFAIYLGKNLFLSVMGNNKPLFVTTLNQMKFIYNDQKAMIVTPIREPVTNACNISCSII